MNEELVKDFMTKSTSQLHASIAKYVSEIRVLEEDKKAYVAGVRDAVKELNDRIDTILAVLKRKRDGEE
jgi:DNA-binding phage protein